MSDGIFDGLVAWCGKPSIDSSSSSTVVDASLMSLRQYALKALFTIIPTVLGIKTMNHVLDIADLKIVLLEFLFERGCASWPCIL